MRYTKLMTCSVVCSILLSGCFSPVKVAPEARYTFATWPEKLNVPRQSVTRNTVLVNVPVAASGYQTSRMIYVQVPYELQSYANHAWVAPPAHLLLPLLANNIRATGYFKAVVTPPFSGNVTYELNTQLLMLQQEFLQPESSIHMIMEATLIRTSTNQVVASRVFETTVPAPGNDPYAGVLAANTAAHQLIARITRFAANQGR